MSITTKTGDSGSTGLIFNRRVPKTHPQVEAYGSVDELNAALGLCRSFCDSPWLPAKILHSQKELVTLMGELAVLPDDRDKYKEKGFQFVFPAMVDQLTTWGAEIEREGIKYEGWATPGKTQLSAFLDLARTACRRAERRVFALGEDFMKLNPDILRYLNRLSDLLWLFARKVEAQAR
jgi:cob(I)alamin adenosyltransferase